MRRIARKQQRPHEATDLKAKLVHNFREAINEVLGKVPVAI
jgi:hypothetical protein